MAAPCGPGTAEVACGTSYHLGHRGESQRLVVASAAGRTGKGPPALGAGGDAGPGTVAVGGVEGVIAVPNAATGGRLEGNGCTGWGRRL